jgi:thymidylate synthase (FAD)
MKLIKPSYTIITPINGEEILKQIEIAARTCYQSEGKIEYEDNKIELHIPKQADKILHQFKAKSARLLIQKLISLNHEAMLEFGGMITVRFICDRGVSHELVRHRVASFAQESTRYCNYTNDKFDGDITFIIPNWLPDVIPGVYNNSHAMLTWVNAMKQCESNYVILIKEGWSAQQARSVLPNSLKTEINVSANIREWRHIFKLRTAKAAHPQMREIMCPLLDEFKNKIPILFDDIN